MSSVLSLCAGLGATVLSKRSHLALEARFSARMTASMAAHSPVPLLTPASPGTYNAAVCYKEDL